MSTPEQLTFGMVEQPAQRDTSAAAAEAIAPMTGRMRMVVLRAIVAAGEYGLTDEEGIAATRIPASTYRPRRVELWKGWKDFDGGYVVDTGARRPTYSGRPAAVWVATRKGRDAL